MDLDERERYEPVMFMYNPDIYLKRQRGIFVSKSTGKNGFLLTAYRSADTDNTEAAGLSLVYECRAASQWIVHGRYQATILSVCIHAEEDECMHGTEMESWLPSGSPAERKPCPLTLSVSFKHFIGCVKHLSLWGLWNCGREGGGGGDRWTDKSGFAVIVGLPVWGMVRFGPIPFKTPIKKHASLCQLTYVISSQESFFFFFFCSSINSNIFLKTYLSSYANWSMMIHVCHTTQKHKCKHKQAHTQTEKNYNNNFMYCAEAQMKL